MTKPATDKQISFRASLLGSKVAKMKADSKPPAGVTVLQMWDANKSASMDDWYVNVAGDGLMELAFALALPEPADSAECSEQIDALKGGGGAYEYARSRPEFGNMVVGRLIARYGDDRDALPRVVTVGELRAVATGAASA